MNTNLTGFSTWNYFFDKNPKEISNIKLDNNVLFGFRKDPTFRFWVKKFSDTITIFEGKPNNNKIRELKETYHQAFELIIFAENEMIAQNINDLIHGIKLLIYPSIAQSPKLLSVMDVKYSFVPDKNIVGNTVYDNMNLICSLVVKVLENKKLIYSIEKYRFSLGLDSISPHSVSPIYGQIFSIDDRGYSYHVKSAYAFLSAYSIIEELGLEIRSSQINPRFLNDNWNPKIKNDMLNRLSVIGISELETINWNIRGIPNELYNQINPKLGINAEWNDSEIIHDCEMKIYDAIHYTSYVRNYFVGHKFDEIVKYINPYDIFNIQSLVRRLILGELNEWPPNINE